MPGTSNIVPDRQAAAAVPRPPSDAGYTLIELSAVLAIAMFLIVASVATLRSVQKADISTAAGRLTSAVRYLYDLSVVTNRPYRLVVDLANNAYWGEPANPPRGCGGAALLPSEEERRFASENPGKTLDESRQSGTSSSAFGAALSRPDAIAALLQGGAEPARTKASPGLLDGGGGEVSAKPAVRERLLERHTLPKGVTVPRVMTGHQDEATEEGTAEIYFFPSGYVEPAYIYLQRGEEIYTVETVPLKGSALVHHEELDSRDLLDES